MLSLDKADGTRVVQVTNGGEVLVSNLQVKKAGETITHPAQVAIKASGSSGLMLSLHKVDGTRVVHVTNEGH
jgi:hypothetical protein